MVALCKMKPNFKSLYGEPSYNTQQQEVTKTAMKFRSIINNHLSSRNDIESIHTANINEHDELKNQIQKTLNDGYLTNPYLPSLISNEYIKSLDKIITKNKSLKKRLMC